MKTTLELPDDLVRELKLRAIDQRTSMKEVAAELLRSGLRSPHATEQSSKKRVTLPLVPAPAGAKPFDLSEDALDELELKAERDAASV